MTKKLTTEEFIERSKLIHGDLYDYSLVEYKNITSKIKIIDPEYGIFEQKPVDHLLGKGNIKRGLVNGASKLKLTTEEFIEKARKIHGDLYDYSKVNYNKINQEVIIIDPIYGEFLQKPSNHLAGHGCKKRFYDKIQKITSSYKNNFIEKSKLVHGDFYDYSLVEYKNKKTKVKIIDPEYGIFEQTPEKHINGNINKKRLGLEKLTTEEFIEKARKIHGDLYDYSKVNYINMITNVILIDKNGYETLQTPYNHLRGHIPLSIYSKNKIHLDHIIPVALISSSSDRKIFNKKSIGKLFNIKNNLIKLNCLDNYKKGDKIELFGKTINARHYRGDEELIRYLFKRTFNLDIIINENTVYIKQLKILLKDNI